MKTIAVSENAYNLLATWKNGRSDTFSAVIERLIPQKGTLSAAFEAAQALPELSATEFESLETAVNATRKEISHSLA